MSTRNRRQWSPRRPHPQVRGAVACVWGGVEREGLSRRPRPRWFGGVGLCAAAGFPGVGWLRFRRRSGESECPRRATPPLEGGEVQGTFSAHHILVVRCPSSAHTMRGRMVRLSGSPHLASSPSSFSPDSPPGCTAFTRGVLLGKK